MTYRDHQVKADLEPGEWQKIRAAVIERDQSTCQGPCGKVLPPSGITIDHVVPLSAGGDPHDPANLRVMCAEDHRAKSDKEARLGQLGVFKSWRRRRAEKRLGLTP